MSFMFVRKPYGRIFSAYNNKIHNPNTKYWNKVGRKVVQNIRDQPTHDSLTYGHDVTFSEMIRYLVYALEEGKEIDYHFIPMSKKCDPCKMNFDYLGKMESFSDDAHFIIAKLKQKYKNVYISFGDSETETALDSAQSHVRLLYGALKATEGITYPQYNFFLRTWRDLQIRGYLSKHINMPISRNQASNTSSEEFFSLIKEALQQPMNITEVKQQRTEAMVQAYRSVSLADMEKLAKYVELDCLLFGYDTRPKLLFERGITFDDPFDYFDGV